MKQGKLKYREDVAQGIASAPQAFIGMLQGKNQGKQLVQLSSRDQPGARKPNHHQEPDRRVQKGRRAPQ